MACRKQPKKQEKQEWALEKPKLDNARKLRGINFIDPEDEEYKETIKNARNELEVPNGSCYALQDGDEKACLEVTGNCGENTDRHQKTKYACIVEAHESTRKRLESTLPRNHEDHIAVKGFNSLTHYNLFPMLQAMTIPGAEAAVNKESEKLEKFPPWNLEK